MKKLLIFILLITMIPCAVVFGAFDVVEADYEYTINNDHWFNLATGVYEYNVDYNTTNRIAIKYDSINLDNFTSFHHLLFFKNNEYLGYYNSQITTYIVPETFLGVLNTFTPSIPTGATHFVVVDYNNYKNLLPIAELNNHTLKEVFEVNNEIKDPYFNQLTYWAYVGESYYDSINKKGVLLSTTGAYSSITRPSILNINDVYYSNMQIDSITGVMTSDSFNNIIYSNTGFKSFIEIAKLSYYELKRYGVSPVNAVLDNINVINLTSLGISSLTVAQMDSYHELYRYNLASNVYYQHYRNLTDNPPLITYIYNKPIPDDTPPLDKLDNFLDDLGIGSKGFKLFISIAVIAITMILLVIVFNAPTLLIVMSAVLEVVLFVFMKWIPNYVIIVLAVIVFILIVKEKGGKNEE